MRDDTKVYPTYIDHPFVYTCYTCHTHLLGQDHILSRAFHGQYGVAYLVGQVVNVSVGPKEERMMTTGIHTVADIYCAFCQAKVGWKYIKAHEARQHYKQGKFVVEKTMLTKEKNYERNDKHECLTSYK